MRTIKQASIFIFLLLILIACIGGDRNDTNALEPPSSTNEFAVLPIEVSESVIEGELTLNIQDLELLGVKTKQGQILPVAGTLEDGNVKMGFVAIKPVQSDVAELVFSVMGNNPQTNVISFKGTLASKERQDITANLKSLQFVSNDPLRDYNLQALMEQSLASTANLGTQQNDSRNITLKAEFANYPLGDINQNKQIDFEDALTALLFNYGINKDNPTEYQLYHADIDCSGKIDLEDIIDLLLRLYKLRTPYLQVCPKRIDIKEGESTVVLIGGVSLGSVTIGLAPDVLPAEVLDISKQGSEGKAVELFAKSKGKGSIEIEGVNGALSTATLNIFGSEGIIPWTDVEPVKTEKVDGSDIGKDIVGAAFTDKKGNRIVAYIPDVIGYEKIEMREGINPFDAPIDQFMWRITSNKFIDVKYPGEFPIAIIRIYYSKLPEKIRLSSYFYEAGGGNIISDLVYTANEDKNYIEAKVRELNADGRVTFVIGVR